VEGMRTAYKSLAGKPRRRWKDNTKMGLRETGLEGVDWIRVTWLLAFLKTT
jgi:hypothetical protein